MQRLRTAVKVTVEMRGKLLLPGSRKETRGILTHRCVWVSVSCDDSWERW